MITVTRKIILRRGSEIRLSGLQPDQVIFNIRRGSSEITEASTARGIFLSVDGSISISGGSTVYGSVLGSATVNVTQGSRLIETG